eukprot:76240_1
MLTLQKKPYRNPQFRNLAIVAVLLISLNMYGIEFFTKSAAQFSIGHGSNLYWFHHDYIQPTHQTNTMPHLPGSAHPNHTMKIPKIIHQTFKTINGVPARWDKSERLWKQYHPQEDGWQYMFWNDTDIDIFMNTHYAWLVPLYYSYPNYMQRVDVFRYCVLHHYGGIYSDLDISPKRNIAPLLSSSSSMDPIDVMLVETPNFGVTNSLMAATNNSDFLYYVLHRLSDYHSNTTYNGRFISRLPTHCQVLFSTGSTVLWILYGRYYADGGKDNIGILNKKHYGRLSLCCLNKRKRETEFYSYTVNDNIVSLPAHCDSYFDHVKGSSWHNAASWHINFYLHCHPVTTVFFVGVILWIAYHMYKMRCQRDKVFLWIKQNIFLLFGCVVLVLICFSYNVTLCSSGSQCV